MKKAIKIAAIVLAVIAAGIFALWCYEQYRSNKAAEEESDQDVIPDIVSGNYYLDGDSTSSPYWFEIKDTKVTLHGDMDKYIADWGIDYLPDNEQTEGSDNATERGEPDDEDLGYETPTYSRLKELLDTKLEKKILQYDPDGDVSNDDEFYIVNISPEGSIRSKVKVEFDYVSEKEFQKDGKTFKLAQ